MPRTVRRELLNWSFDCDQWSGFNAIPSDRQGFDTVPNVLTHQFCTPSSAEIFAACLAALSAAKERIFRVILKYLNAPSCFLRVQFIATENLQATVSQTARQIERDSVTRSSDHDFSRLKSYLFIECQSDRHEANLKITLNYSCRRPK